MKKIAYLVTIILTILYIYIITQDTKVYYLALGDDITIGRLGNNEIVSSFPSSIESYLSKKKKLEKVLTEFANIGYRTTDILNDINNNKKISIESNDISIKNAIIKADIITISIGMNDFINYIDDYKLLKDNLVNLKKDMEILLKTIRNISKEKIILIGIYNPNVNNEKIFELLEEINRIYESISRQNNMYYLNIFEEISQYINSNQYFPNESGYEIISKKLLSYIERDIIT